MDRYLDLIYLAAGQSLRYGSNKLLVPFKGKPLFQYGLDSLEAYHQKNPANCRIIVVTRFPEIIAAAEAIGAIIVENNQPDTGISLSIRLGLSAAVRQTDKQTETAAVFLVADQPWLKPETLAAFLDHARQTPAGILTAGHSGIPGNPVSFDQAFFPELNALEGDHGGRIICIRHQEETEWHDVSPHEQVDIDHLEAEGLDQP